MRLQIKQNRDSLGLLEENRGRRGAGSSGSTSKQAAELRASRSSRVEPGSMVSLGEVEEGDGCSGSGCEVLLLVLLPVLTHRPQVVFLSKSAGDRPIRARARLMVIQVINQHS